MGICNQSNEADTSEIGPDACGGETRGRCTFGKVCECNDGWTGPHCLVPFGSDPITWEIPETFEFQGPSKQPIALGIIILSIGFVMVLSLKDRAKKGYIPIQRKH